jgi:hypothetical protein
MPTRLSLLLSVLALIAAGGAFAQNLVQNKVKTETIRPPVATQPERMFKPDGQAAAARPAATAATVISDLSRLPAAVAATRERILAAARSGELEKLLAVMQVGGKLPIFSFSEDKDPIGFWRANYPDSGGIEVLSILINVLEAAFIHVDVGTPQEVYIWPYFARLPLKSLSPQQKVELFRIVTGADYKDMIEFGAYSFYRVGIAPDGTWHFFVAGD